MAAPPVQGGVFRLPLESPSTLDPAFTNDAYEATVTNQIFSGLVKWDADLNVLPDVAQSWTISRDGREYVFSLRHNARFQNGRQVTAQDFVYSFTRLFNSSEVPPGIIQDYLRKISGVDDYVAGRSSHISGLEAPDPFTLVIRLDKPYASFLTALAMDQGKVVPREEIERLGAAEFGRRPVGSGPFRLVEWQPDVQMVLAANADYYGQRAYLDTVVVLHYPNDGGERQRADFFAGRLDAREVRENELAELNAQGAYPLVRRLELSMEFLGMNVSRPPFDDARVRRAVAMALDRESLSRVAGPGFRVPVGLLPPGMPGYTPESKILPQDPERARALLAEAGYGPGHPLRFQLFTSSRSNHAVLRDSVIAASLRRVGVDLDLHDVPWTELIAAVDGKTAPAFELTWIADLPDPESFLYTLLASGGGSNLFEYHNARVDSLLILGRDEPSPQNRLALYRESERLILDEAPLVPLFNVMTLYAFQPFVHGVEMSPMGISSIPMEKIWLGRRSPEGLYAGF